MQLEARASVARERFTRVGRLFAQLREPQSAHARTSPRRQHNCAIVYDLPPNLEPRAACLDSRVFGGKHSTVVYWILAGFGVDPVLPYRTSGQHIGAFGPCAITFSTKISCVVKQAASDTASARYHAWTRILRNRHSEVRGRCQIRNNIVVIIFAGTRRNTFSPSLREAHAQVRATLPARSSRGL